LMFTTHNDIELKIHVSDHMLKGKNVSRKI